MTATLEQNQWYKGKSPVVREYLQTAKQIEDAVRWTAAAGIRTKGFFMMGNPLETKETLQKTIDFSRRLDLADFHVTFLSPMPGSEIYANAEKYGVFENDWKRLTGWHLVFIPYGLSKGILEKYRKKAFLKFYLRPKVIFSYLKNIRYFSDIRKMIIGGYTLITSSISKIR